MDIKILEIASDTKNVKNISNFTHTSKLKNNLCGDEVRIELVIKKNFVKNFGYNCKSCVYCQASASIISKFSLNKSIKSINKTITFFNKFFEDHKVIFPKNLKKFEVLFNKKNLARKECILLPFKALTKALKSKNEKRNFN